MLETVSITF